MGKMTEINEVYDLMKPVKGWPVKDAHTLDEAAESIFGSPYWDIPEDRYQIVDCNETYSLVAVLENNRRSRQKRYMVVNMDWLEYSERALPDDPLDYPGKVE